MESSDLETLIISIARSPLTPVLIEGSAARDVALRIHEKTRFESRDFRGRTARFVSVDCTWLPAEEAVPLLFGVADPARRGLIERANLGTLYLEDVSDLPQPAQARLAALIDAMRFRREGGARHIEVSLRVVGSVRRNLQRVLASGRLRQDLYRRLSVFHLVVP